MKPRYLQAETAGRDRWTVSYVDILTILLLFFVAAASKIPAVAKVAAAPPPPPKVEKSALQIAQERLASKGLDAKLEERGLVVSLPQAILFGAGDDRVDESALPAIEKVAGVIAEMPNQVILCGHADSTPIHNRRFASNWELSSARGLRLLQVLVQQYGIEEARLSVASDGANRPIAPNDTADGRASNRRVEIVIAK